MDRFSVEFVIQEAVGPPMEFYVKKRIMSILLRVNGELVMPVKAIQMVKDFLHILFSVCAEDKCVIGIKEPAKEFCVSLVLRPFPQRSL